MLCRWAREPRVTLDASALCLLPCIFLCLPLRDSCACLLTLCRWAGEPRVTLDAVAQACIDRLHTFAPQELATTLWAFASQRHVHPPLFAAVVATVAEREAEFGIQVGRSAKLIKAGLRLGYMRKN